MLGPALRISVAAALSAAIVPLPAHAAQTRSGPRASASGSVWRFTPAQAPSRPRRPLALSAVPESPLAGQPVRLAVLGLASPTAAYSWEPVGGTEVPLQTPSAPQVTMRFAVAGVHRVGVTVLIGQVAQQATISVVVRSRPPVPGGIAPASRLAGHGVPASRAHAAADPGVTISDFHFTASSVTIHAGDTITWTNDGPSSHTATATNGSFNTGVLKKGASASHTFTQPGTYTYVCQIHPFMRGTVVVLAAAGATPATPQPAAPSSAAASGNSTTPATGAGSTTATAAESGPTLPITGFNAAAGALFGLALVGLGLTLRRSVLSR